MSSVNIFEYTKHGKGMSFIQEIQHHCLICR